MNYSKLRKELIKGQTEEMIKTIDMCIAALKVEGEKLQYTLEGKEFVIGSHDSETLEEK